MRQSKYAHTMKASIYNTEIFTQKTLFFPLKIIADKLLNYLIIGYTWKKKKAPPPAPLTRELASRMKATLEKIYVVFKAQYDKKYYQTSQYNINTYY